MGYYPSESIINEQFLLILNKIFYPGFDIDIVTIKLVEEAKLVDAKAIIKLRPLVAPSYVLDQLENDIAIAFAKVPGIKELDLIQSEFPQAHKFPIFRTIDGVEAIIPIASGKGGVGKSTVAVNLALGLNSLGLRVGLLDLDVYGPSIPLMLGLSIKELKFNAEKFIPIEAHGLKIMSIGFMVDSSKALIWRSPIVIKAVKQLLYDVAWMPLDILILDLPPGTGDVQITMLQELPITGAIVVTTPQEVALIDAIKAVDMFNSTKSLVLGIIENMSFFVCDNCNKRHEIFSHGAVEPLAKKLKIDYLGELPLDVNVRASMDSGMPVVKRNIPSALPYHILANKIWKQVNELKFKKEDFNDNTHTRRSRKSFGNSSN